MTDDFTIVPQQPPCVYFGNCGGCSIQNISNHREYKFHLFKTAVAELNINKIHELIQIEPRTRRRTNFKISNKKISFSKAQSSQLVKIADCLLLEDSINQLIAPLNNVLKNINITINNISITNSDSGIEIIFLSNKRTDLDADLIITDFAKQQNISRVAWQINQQIPYLIVQFKPVQLKFDNAYVDLPINSFLQVSKKSNAIMTNIILEHLDHNQRTLELYCGAGSFTIPIASKNNVTAVEGDIEAIKALEDSGKRHKLPIKTVLQDLYQNPISAQEIDRFSQVIINPPRNGASPQIKQIASANNISKVILISCSLENFIRDAKILIREDFVLDEIYPIDQFLYTKHLEIIGVFKKN